MLTWIAEGHPYFNGQGVAVGDIIRLQQRPADTTKRSVLATGPATRNTRRAGFARSGKRLMLKPWSAATTFTAINITTHCSLLANQVLALNPSCIQRQSPTALPQLTFFLMHRWFLTTKTLSLSIDPTTTTIATTGQHVCARPVSIY